MSQSGKYGLGVTPPITVPDGGTGVATITDHALIVGSGTAAITVLAAATDGQIPIGSTGADPVLANITSTGGTVTVTNGAGTINLEIGGAVATSYSTDSGSAVPALGILTVAGGTNINTAGAGSTVTVNLDTAVSGLTSLDLAAGGRFGTSTGAGETALIQAYDTGGASYTTFATLTANATPTMDLDDAVTKAGQYIYRAAGTDVPVTDGGTGASTLTDHGVLVGSGTAAVTAITVGTDGQVLVGSSAADPVFATLASSDGSITYATGAGTLGLTVTQATTGQLGGSTLATTAEVTTGTDTQKIVTCAGIAAKLGTQTDHGVLVGSGSTAAVTALAVGTDGQVLLGSTGADPVFATLASSGSTIAFTPGAGSLNLETGSAVCTSVATDSGTATPAAGVLTIAGAGSASTSGAGSTVTITCTGGGMSRVEATGATQAMAVNTIYTTNNAAQIDYTLPATAAVGDIIKVVGNSANGWTISQNAGQTIHFLSSDTTTGVGGSLTSTTRYDCVEVTCITANTDFCVSDSVGNITIV